MVASLTLEDSDWNYPVTIETCVFEEVLEKVSNDICSICQSITPNLIYKSNVKQEQMVATRKVEDLNWNSHLQCKTIVLKKYFAWV